MAAAKLIGVYARVAGVWQRCNGGTAVGYSGPQVKASGFWWNCVWVHAKASSAWQVTWTNVEGEISSPTIGTFYTEDFDISPYSVFATIEIKDNGTVNRVINGSTQTNYSTWRNYDCGRAKEWYVLRDTNYTGTNNTVEPTLSTWSNVSGTLTFTCAKSGSGFLNYDDGWAFYARDTERADPLGSVPRADVDIVLEAEGTA